MTTDRDAEITTEARIAQAKQNAQVASTPMMQQFWQIKADHPDHLLFFRMGDFYELFFEDAVVAAAALDIALTKRGKHDGAEVSMCGVPHHSYEAYLAKLIRKGHRVAICEQLEDPAEAKKRGSKAVVKRGVTRVVTSGTLTEDGLLDARASNHLVAVCQIRSDIGLAWADVSTGHFYVATSTVAALPAQLARLNPSELLVPDALLQEADLFEVWAEYQNRISPRPTRLFDARAGEARLKDTYEVGSVEGFGNFSRAELAAAGALLDYINLTQVETKTRLFPPVREEATGAMVIDAATRRSLELTRTQAGEKSGSLLATIDRTVTSGGARLLQGHISAPLTDPVEITARQDMVAVFVADGALRDDVRHALRQTPDIERALTRLSLGRGGPRDLAALRDALSQADVLKHRLSGLLETAPARLQQAVAGLGHFADLVDRLTRALADDLPLLARDGGFIRAGFHAGLDELKTLRDESRRLIAGLEASYKEQTGVTSLKVKHNNVLGYFVEVTAVHGDKLMAAPLNETFIHRQTTANQVRFTTVELNDFAQRISRAGDQAVALELDLFADLVTAVKTRESTLVTVAGALAALDVASSLAALAVSHHYVRPKVDDSVEFSITGGRHPVVEQAVSATDSGFVANDCTISGDRRLWLLTGPNMAGKSTFLRQNALIAILAHMGSYVPAEVAHMGVIDKLFSRVGAADDLARGRSTFMVEMVETAAILNQATARSLVILDEIGRGTATYDGLSIAWAAIEHLHGANQSRALFATHYHELTALAQRLDHVACYTLAIREWEDRVIFLHEVIAGAADRSYGIQVAKLAGLPKPVVHRAEEVLHLLEAGDAASVTSKLADDLPLFAAAEPLSGAEAAAGGVIPEASRVLEKLSEIDPDHLSPREALEALYALKAEADPS